MNITGAMLIGAEDVFGSNKEIRAINPATNETLEPGFKGGNAQDVDRACRLAQRAFASYRETTLEQRAVFLEEIAEQIMALGDDLITRAHQESGLPLGRLQGERGRTVGQLRLFASVVRAGRWLDARVDNAQPNRTPMPRSDIRLRYIPLGPVAVFGASNFPLAFSVAGGDTASALAAGAPVIVKAHSAHPGTSELVGRAVRKAVQQCGLDEGVFSLLFGAGSDVGQGLAAHPIIKAVAFTGSRNGGVALMHTAAARPEPIPVYAEMSSINPVFLMPAALKAQPEKIAQGFVASLLMGAGQFCTNPGLVIGLASPELDTFVQASKDAVAQSATATMLTPGIHSAYQKGVEQLSHHADIEVLARGQASNAPNQCQSALLRTTADAFLKDPHGLGMEVFGSSSLVIECRDAAQMLAIVEALEGQLTATLQIKEGEDQALLSTLIPALELKVGRILANGYPTGVEVCHAMVHGGPFPATSDSRSTSVGTAAIYRFLRPVSYQDIPDALLPEALKAANPWSIPRLED
ncbi:aldehyde dehydrogenase (NADP(+)) [Paralcaligenes sp. KSB-10]|uniref:aldehyde dehydrogenase (NADP(+)) n=1 Tax=Paralcaligenes sp. KSB-10 TaxID=2901142 RepID=UPI001E45D964|nr:aldehyde dehydrogenase (NADP(+)) [Paralcaligenes sp. KSB-10]UHL63214.1 aldehyde dehydrogenase (NADP(+)) [Paralcaligenes sp. KSB-10]